ncbi:MAG: hypothetical protein P8P55_07780 [Flavobacteriaceae bacterium]|jgi:hypothetical protein|nr:hypothetical protein [Flavobacteriaceae bacterium]
MNIIPHKKVLQDLKDLLIQMDEDSFCHKNKTLFGGSIGEHFRHIIEFYLCCLSQKGTKNVNYDVRKRDKQLEIDIGFGIATIDTLISTLTQLEAQDDKPMFMKNCMEDEKENNLRIETSFFRELIYCMDHCIHHQSLIKTALLEQNLIHFIDSNFGVAFSTQIYRSQCAS